MGVAGAARDGDGMERRWVFVLLDVLCVLVGKRRWGLGVREPLPRRQAPQDPAKVCVAGAGGRDTPLSAPRRWGSSGSTPAPRACLCAPAPRVLAGLSFPGCPRSGGG